MENTNKKTFLEKFTEISVKVGNQVHLKSLRDAFSTIMPMFILAGLGVMLSYALFPLFLKGSTLLQFQTFGTVITNGTLNIAGLLVCPMIAYFLSRNKDFKNPIGAMSVSTASLIVMMAITYNLVPTNVTNGKTVPISGILTFANLGTQGMFSGIIIGLLATEIFIRLSNLKHLKINLGEGVPPAVGASFDTLLPTLLTVSFWGVLSAVLSVVFHTNLILLITTIIQEPLRGLTTSLVGYIVIYSTGNFLFSLGIHQTVINGSLLDPFMLINMNENMAAKAAGKPIPHILNSDFQTVFAQMGGTGLTFALIIAVLIFFRKNKAFRNVIGLATGPGLFEINEPIIFGFPIVFNLPMMIPFVLSPIIGTLIGYFATAIGFIHPMAILVPWTTPPLLSGWVASGGDLKVVFVQIIVLAVCTLFYLPFLKIAENVAKRQQENNI